MRRHDAMYYADQINLFTAFEAEAKGYELIVRLAGKTVERTREADRAEALYYECVRKTPSHSE